MTTQDLAHVPGRAHYALRYFRGGRVFSYAHQIDAVLSFEPKRVLEVGVGAGVVAAALRAMGIEVSTADIQPELNPDIEGSVTNLGIDDGAFDVALCCQVLEHLPIDLFEIAVRELHRVTRQGLVLSLPDATPHYSLGARLPRVGAVEWSGTRPKAVTKKVREQRWNDAGHYWEIGYPEVPCKRINDTVRRCGWDLRRTWRVPECPYHRFFRLEHSAQ